MKFLVVLALIGCAFADQAADPINQARAMMANRILTADPATFIDCRADEANGCASKPGWKCNPLMKLCSPGNAPKMEEVEGTCQTTSDCRPLYRCSKTNQCAFVGPKACSTDGDCSPNVAELQFECKELPKNAPGKRCWMKCSSDDECHGCSGGVCRVPANFREKIGCGQGYCQRKAAFA